MAEPLARAGYALSIEETHHVTKLDSPSGTALSLQQAGRSSRRGADHLAA